MTLPRTIIGLCAPKESGKSVVANFLTRTYPDSLVLPFAAPLKRAACDLFGIDPALVSTAAGKQKTVVAPLELVNIDATTRALSLTTGIRIYELMSRAAPQHALITELGFNSGHELRNAFHLTINVVYEVGAEYTVREVLQKWGTELMRDGFRKDFWVLRMRHTLESCGAEMAIIDDVRFCNEADAIRELGGTVLGIRRPETWDTGDAHPSEQEMRDHWENICDAVVLNDGSITELKQRALDTLHLR